MSIANIPKELKQLERWVVWGVDKNKPKIPYNPRTMQPAKASKPETWGSFEQAAQQVTDGRAQGVGFEFHNDGYFGIDLDKVLTGNQLSKDAQAIVDELDSYTEYSPSKTGLHVIVKAGGVKLDANRKGFLEVYHEGRYFTFTGQVFDKPKPIQERSAALRSVHDRYLKRERIERKTPSTLLSQSDDDILMRARAAKNGETFARLWSGDTSGYNSASEADLALCNLLAFYTQCNAEQMDRLYRGSGLCRDKWDRRQSGSTYGALTIAKAIADCGAVYDPKPRAGVSTTPAKQEKSYRPTDFTDTANARLFAREYLGQALYCTTTGWLVWDSKRWEENEFKSTNLAMRLTDKMLAEARTEVKTAGIALAEAKAAQDSEAMEVAKKADKAARDYLKHSIMTRAKNRIAAMLYLAQSLLCITPDRLDADPYILNTPAGMVDLQTGQIVPHDPLKLCTKITKCSPGVKGADRWAAHLRMVACGDEKLTGFLQQISGMAAIGSVFEENLIIGIGDGKNGKSAHFNSQSIALGDYAGTLSADALTTAGHSKGAELASLKGKRLIIAAETDEGARLSTSMLKQLTSTDKIHAERKYKDPEDFTPSHTAILYTNHFPRVGSTDTGTWRRIVPVPFDAKIAPEQEVKNYAEVLAREAGEAIMQWIVDGAVNFYRRGHRLVKPECVEILLEDYKERNDWLGEFLEEFCEVGRGRSVKSGVLYDTYHRWAGDAHNFARRLDAFNVEMEKRGFERRKTETGAHWYGLSLRFEMTDLSYHRTS